MPHELPLETDCHTTKSMLDARETVLIDCRDPDEHATASIPGARLIPMGGIADRLHELQPHREHSVVVHCHHGGRSLRVTRWLREQGFSRVQSMAGGIDLWSQEIDPSVPRY